MIVILLREEGSSLHLEASLSSGAWLVRPEAASRLTWLPVPMLSKDSGTRAPGRPGKVEGEASGRKWKRDRRWTEGLSLEVNKERLMGCMREYDWHTET
jgi:hypothetical protein